MFLFAEPAEFPGSISVGSALRRNFTHETDQQLLAAGDRFKPTITYVQVDGPEDTFKLIIQLIQQGRGQWDVIEFSRRLTKGVAERDHIGNIFTLFKEAQKSVKYQFDPWRLEMLLPAQLIIKYRDLGFDCDDIGATLLGSLLLSLGYRVQLVMGGKKGGSSRTSGYGSGFPNIRIIADNNTNMLTILIRNLLFLN